MILSLILLMAFLIAPSTTADAQTNGRNLVKNADFEQPEVGGDPVRPAHFELLGDASYRYAGTVHEISSMGVALDSGRDLNGDGRREGSVSQAVAIESSLPGRWYRFKIRGLPEDGFAIASDDLHMKVDFFADHGRRPLDGVTRKIFPLIEQERKDLTANGVLHKGGAATWKTYSFEFRLPFPDIDQVRLIVGFRGGRGQGRDSSMLVDEFSLEPIPAPSDPAAAVAPIRPAAPSAVDVSKLVSLGGPWSYLPAPDEAVAHLTTSLLVNQRNADRLFFHDGGGSYLNPFAENMSAWLREGYLDLDGNLVEQDVLRPDNVTVSFDGSSMIVRAHNLPNHPTAKFPSPRGSGDRNPSYIQEKDSTYYLPLKPRPDPEARAMENQSNANRALPMGPIGIAINGVVFFNPFDAGMSDATDLMDRCCGHPSPDNRYHYHKYPVCVKSPFADEGKGHSPLIGWAFDGFAIYGPYEAEGVMAKDSRDNPLNAFNVHQDPQRGWHYHVTPGKFPYIIGGYWGIADARNFRGGGMMGRGGPVGGPLLEVLDADRDGELSASEIQRASEAVKALDRNRDGQLTPDELRPQAPGGPRVRPD